VIRRLAILIAFALVLIAASEDSWSVQHKAQAKPSQKTVEKQQAQVPVVPLSVMESVQTALREALGTIKQQAIAAEKQAESYKETYYSPPVVVNGVLALIGIGYLVLMGLQWQAIQEGNQNARQALEITQRAYLNVENITTSNFQDGEAPIVEFDIRNRGRLPASRVAEWVSTSISDKPCAVLTSMSSGYPVPEGFGRVIPADTTVHRIRQFGLPQEWQLQAINAEKAILQLEITIIYLDGFDKRREWSDLLIYFPRLKTFQPWSTRQAIPEAPQKQS
jgi:hypothetical protein